MVANLPHPVLMPASLPSSASSSPPPPQPPPQPPPLDVFSAPCIHPTAALQSSAMLQLTPSQNSAVPPPPLTASQMFQPNPFSSSSASACAIHPLPSPTTPTPTSTPSNLSHSLNYPVLGNGLTVDAIFLRAERVFEQRVDTLLHAKRCKALQSGTAFNARKAKRDARTVAGREKLDALVRRLADLAAAQHALLAPRPRTLVSSALDGAAAAIIGIAALNSPAASTVSSTSTHSHFTPHHQSHHALPQQQQQQDAVGNDSSSCSDDSVHAPASRHSAALAYNVPCESDRQYHHQETPLNHHHHPTLGTAPHPMFSATQSVVDFILDCDDEDISGDGRVRQHPFSAVSPDKSAPSKVTSDNALTNVSTAPLGRKGVFSLGIDERKRLRNTTFCGERVDNRKSGPLRNGPISQSASSQSSIATAKFASSPPTSNPSSSSLSSLGSATAPTSSASSSSSKLQTSYLPTVGDFPRPSSMSSIYSSVTSSIHTAPAAISMTSSQPLRGGYIHTSALTGASGGIGANAHTPNDAPHNSAKNTTLNPHRGQSFAMKQTNRLDEADSKFLGCHPDGGRSNQSNSRFNFTNDAQLTQVLASSTLSVNSAGSYESVSSFNKVTSSGSKSLDGGILNKKAIGKQCELSPAESSGASPSPLYIEGLGDKYSFGFPVSDVISSAYLNRSTRNINKYNGNFVISASDANNDRYSRTCKSTSSPTPTIRGSVAGGNGNLVFSNSNGSLVQHKQQFIAHTLRNSPSGVNINSADSNGFKLVDIENSSRVMCSVSGPETV